MSHRAKIVLVTGFPTSFVAARVVRQLLANDPDVELRCLVRSKSLSEAKDLLGELRKADRNRVRVLEGDVASMDLGLSGQEFLALADEVEIVHHCAAASYLGVDRRLAERTNVDGAREVLELCEAAPRLQRLVHWSTASVSGARRGYVLESELDDAAGFHNVVEETRYRAEKMIQEARSSLPVTILRPSLIVGDSITGAIHRLEGPYLLVLLLLSSPPDLRLPMPGRGDVPLNMVPIDYVVAAGLQIAGDARSVHRVFHIVDPDAPTARRVFELVAGSAGRPIPRGFLPANLATTILRTPGLDRLAHVPRAFLEQLRTEVVYDDRNTRELLAGTGIACPPFASYVDAMVAFVRKRQDEHKARGVDELRSS